MNKTENPSAFPWANDADKQYNWISRGMTLRDYMAAKAMNAIVASCIDNGFNDDLVAAASYRLADAMLKARE